MPTHHELAAFLRDYRALSQEQRERFLDCMPDFRADVASGRFRPAFRVRLVHTARGTGEVWEMTFAPDGRATFHYGAELIPGQPHIIWRRIGTHDIFRNP